MQIVENIWQVGGDGLSAPGDAAVYLVVFGGSAALIDAGCGPGHRRVVDSVSKCLKPGVTVETLFITHCHYDHTGGAGALRDHYGCKIVAHALDAEFLESGDSEVTAASWYGAEMPPLSIDHKISGPAETFTVGSGTIEALHCPGHSPGSVVYLTESAGRRVLFGQDVHGPLHPSLLSCRDDYLTSLTQLLGLNADILCEGHFGIFKGKEEIENFIQSFMR